MTQFSGANFITMRLDNNFTDYSYNICQDAGFFLKSYFQTDDFLIKMNLVREGMGVAFLPEACLENAFLLCPGMRAFHSSRGSEKRTVLIKRKKKSLLSEASLDFWEFMIEYFDLPSDEQD